MEGGVVSSDFAFQVYHDNIGDFDGHEEKERTQVQTEKIIDALCVHGWPRVVGCGAR
jgi:carbamate kinase